MGIYCRRLNYKLFIHLMLFCCVLVFLAKPSIADEGALKKRDHEVKTVYIDPSYGGWEIGPVFGPGRFGKNFTLTIALRLHVLLKADGLSVILSRSGDQFIALDQRVAQARSKHANFSVVLKTSLTRENCVQISTIPPPPKAGRQKSNEREAEDIKKMRKEIGGILTELAADSKYKESRTLAESLVRNLRQNKLLSCITRITGKDYVLVKETMPVVIVDFGIASKADQPLYLADPATLESLAQSLAGAIKEYAGQP
jgi:N-acetylmuramoyl-L-alanine amidase